MRFALLAAGITLIASTALAQAPMTPASAYALGQTVGNATVATHSASIASGSATTLVPYYSSASTATATQQSYFSGGMGVISGPASLQNATCATSPTGATQMDTEQCRAINLMGARSTSTVPFTVTRSDPVIVNGTAVANNPGALAAGFTASYTGCTTSGTNVAPVFEDVVCHEWAAGDTQICDMPRVVQVEADYHYQCTQSPKQITNNNCLITNTAGLATSVDFYMPQSCTVATGVFCNNTSSQGVYMAASINNAWAGGSRPNLMINGSKWATITSAFQAFPATGNQAYGACDTLTLWTNGSSCRNLGRAGGPTCASYSQKVSLGRGNVISMCGAASCTGMTIYCDSGGNCNYGCTSQGVPGTCPAGFTQRTDASGNVFCRENTYTSNAANPACVFLGSFAYSMPGTASATKYLWACPGTPNDQCATYEARAL